MRRVGNRRGAVGAPSGLEDAGGSVIERPSGAGRGGHATGWVARRARRVARALVMGALMRITLGVVTGLLSTADATAAATPAADELTDAQLVAAIEAIRTELLDRRDVRRGWDPARWTTRDGSTSQQGGYTALVASALVRSGLSPQTPGLAEAIERLAEADLPGTYARAVRTSLWASGPPAWESRLVRDVEALVAGFDPSRGSWGYRLSAKTGRRDHSLRQYGALAWWDAARRGLDVGPEAWANLERPILESQRDDGGWNYQEDDAPARGSMTAAGIATLLVTAEMLREAEDRAGGEGLTHRARRRAAVQRGLAWFDAHYSATSNPGTGRWFHYYAYGVERVGLASGIVRFAGQDWFRTLSAETIRRLCRDDGAGGFDVKDRRRVDDLAFALLLLARGRVPIGIAKVTMEDTPLDDDPRDVGRLARLIGATTEADLGWIRITASDGPELWDQTPTVVMTGPSAPDGDRAARLVEPLLAHLDRGGWLLVIDTGRGDLAAWVRGLLERHRPDGAWQRAAQDHAAYDFHAVARPRPRLDVFRDAVRDLVVVARGPRWLSGDTGATGRPSTGTRRGGSSPRAERRTAEATILTNLHLAATADAPLRPRLEPPAWTVAGAFEDSPGAFGQAGGRLPTGDPAAARPSVAPVAAAATGPASRLVVLDWPGRGRGEPQAVPTFAAWHQRAGLGRLEIVSRPLADVLAGDPSSVSAEADEGAAAARRSTILIADVDAPAADTLADLVQAATALAQAGHPVLVTTIGGRGDFADAFAAALERGAQRGPGRFEPDAPAGATGATGRGGAGVAGGGRATVSSPAWTHQPSLRAALIDAAPMSIQRVRRSEAGRRAYGPRLVAPAWRPYAPVSSPDRASPRVPTAPTAPIVVSRADLVHALLGRPSWGTRGYDARSARRMMAAVLAWRPAGPADGNDP